MRTATIVVSILLLLALAGCNEKTIVPVLGKLEGPGQTERVPVIILDNVTGAELLREMEQLKVQRREHTSPMIERIIRETELDYTRKGITDERGTFAFRLEEGKKYYAFVMNAGRAWCYPFTAGRGPRLVLDAENAVWMPR